MGYPSHTKGVGNIFRNCISVTQHDSADKPCLPLRQQSIEHILQPGTKSEKIPFPGFPLGLFNLHPIVFIQEGGKIDPSCRIIGLEFLAGEVRINFAGDPVPLLCRQSIDAGDPELSGKLNRFLLWVSGGIHPQHIGELFAGALRGFCNLPGNMVIGACQLLIPFVPRHPAAKPYQRKSSSQKRKRNHPPTAQHWRQQGKRSQNSRYHRKREHPFL